LLRPGGIYSVEDWSWAHHPDYQAPDAPLSKGHALSNLLFEQIMLMGSAWSISEIRVWKMLYLIRKSRRPLPAPEMGQEGEGWIGL
jgi:hypothetical protein